MFELKTFVAHSPWPFGATTETLEILSEDTCAKPSAAETTPLVMNLLWGKHFSILCKASPVKSAPQFSMLRCNKLILEQFINANPNAFMHWILLCELSTLVLPINARLLTFVIATWPSVEML